MKLFTKAIDDKLFKQFPMGNDLEKQMVVTKIFNPYGDTRWFLLNSDPEDPDYIWAIVQMRNVVEVGSVSRRELESIRVKPWGLSLERDLSFIMVNAKELYNGLLQGKFYKKGGFVDGDENKEMILNQAEEFEHHAEEFEEAAKKAKHVPAWVVAKSERASTDLSDITHYLDSENEQEREEMEGEEMAKGGELSVQERKNKTFYHLIWDDNESVKDEYFDDEYSAKKMYDTLVKNGNIKIAHLYKDTFNQYGMFDKHTTLNMYPNYEKGGEMAKGGDTLKKQEWVAIYVNQEKPHERKAIQSFGNTKEEATRNARMSEGYYDIKKPFELTEIYTYSGNLPMMADGGEMEKSEDPQKKITLKRGDYFIVLKDMGNIKRFRIWKIEGKYVTINYSKNDGTNVFDTNQSKSNLMYLLDNGYIKKVTKDEYWKRKYDNYAEGGEMAKGGVTFDDKVKSIEKSLLERKKVSPSVQKDYGKTYSPKEAHESAKRIVGAMTARERLMKGMKTKKKK